MQKVVVTTNIQPTTEELIPTKFNTYVPESGNYYSKVTINPGSPVDHYFTTDSISQSTFSNLPVNSYTTKIISSVYTVGDSIPGSYYSYITLKAYKYTSNGTYYPDTYSANIWRFPAKIVVNVPQNSYETWTNKRIISNNTYTISNLMEDPDLSGISKNSTIVVDVPTYDITQISNYSITSNGIQTVPIPSGYDAVDSISLNVNVSGLPITIDRIYFLSNGAYNTITSNYFTKTTSQTSLVVDNGKGLIVFSNNVGYYNVYNYYNGSGSSKSFVVPADSIYKSLSSSISGQIYLRNGSTNLLRVVDNDSSDSNAYETRLFKSAFYIDMLEN